MEKRKIEGGIICPHCGKYSNGEIIDTRSTLKGRRRRRICEFCNQRYTTIERSVISDYIIVDEIIEGLRKKYGQGDKA